MQNAEAITQNVGTRRVPASNRKAAAIYLLWGFVLTFRGIADLRIHSSHHPQAYFVVGVCLPVLLGLVFCVLGLFLVFGMTSLGSVGYQEIADPRVEQRVRDRYASDLDQLTSLGFSYAYTSGESMSIFRILLIYPALILLQIRAHGGILTLGRGARILLAAPVLTSADGRVFANPQTLGVSFYTAFRNGPLLVTKNYKSTCCIATPQWVMQAEVGTVAEAWQTHKQWLTKLDTEANPANRDRSYQAYADIAHRQDTFIKSQR
jgi:hypothetical protein